MKTKNFSSVSFQNRIFLLVLKFEELHVTICLSRKTCLYSFDSLMPHFYTVKLGFTGVYINFLISAQKHRLWVLFRTALLRQLLTSIHNVCIEQKYENLRIFHHSESFHFLVVKSSVYLNKRVFVMDQYLNYLSLLRLNFCLSVHKETTSVPVTEVLFHRFKGSIFLKNI